MKSVAIILMAVLGTFAGHAQTNGPAASASSSSTNLLPPIAEVHKSSPTLSTPLAPMPATSIKEIPLKAPDESKVSESRSGIQFRSPLLGSPRPIGQKFNPLQLINPFAPARYGGMASATGKSRPRAFLSERDHEPVGITLIEVSK